MMGFPLQLPIDAMAARAVELTDWQGDIAGAGDHRGKALVIAVKSEAEAKALAAWISGIPVAVTVQKEQEKLHAAPFAVAGITPEMIADLIASLRDGAFELPAAMRDKSWAKKSADQIMAVAANVIEQLEAALTRANSSNEHWRKNSRDTFEAMVAMRDSINEHVPMPSLESDLLQGPEDSIFCATMAETVVAAITRATAATAAAYEVAVEACADYPRVAPDEAEWTRYDEQIEHSQRCIRALATPDQTAALDRPIAEAEASVWERAERIARNVGVPVGAGDGCGTYIPGTSADAARAILAASKKGGA